MYSFVYVPGVQLSSGYQRGPLSQKKVYSLVRRPDVDFMSSNNYRVGADQCTKSSIHEKIVEYVMLLSFKHPHTNLLEIGPLSFIHSSFSPNLTFLAPSIESTTLPLISKFESKDNIVWPGRYDVAGEP